MTALTHAKDRPMFSEAPPNFLRVFTPGQSVERARTWGSEHELIEDIETDGELRALLLAVPPHANGTTFERAQGLARAVQARVAALNALRDCSDL